MTGIACLNYDIKRLCTSEWKRNITCFFFFHKYRLLDVLNICRDWAFVTLRFTEDFLTLLNNTPFVSDVVLWMRINPHTKHMIELFRYKFSSKVWCVNLHERYENLTSWFVFLQLPIESYFMSSTYSLHLRWKFNVSYRKWRVWAFCIWSKCICLTHSK